MRRLFVLSLMVGCGGSLRDDRFPTGSSSMAATRHYEALVTVNVDEGTVSRLDRETGAVDEIRVGAEPTRIARVGDDLWVTLRGERGIAVLEDDGDALEPSEVLRTGPEPVGIVASEDGRRVYVAVSRADEVAEYDGKTREKLRTFAVQDEPRWLALHPNGRVLYVASFLNGTLSAIDLRSGEVTALELPEGTRNGPDFDPVDLDPRITGDPAILPDGSAIGVPVVYADTTTTVDVPEAEEPVVEGYGSAGVGVSRMNPVLVTWELGSDGKPAGNPDGVLLAAAPFSEEAPAFEEFGGFQVFRSYASSVTASPTSKEWVVTMEASNAVLVVETDPSEDRFGVGTAVDADTDTTGPGGRDVLPFTSAEEGGFVTHPIVVVTTAAGPRGAVFVSEDDARVYSFIDRSVEDLRYDTVEDALDDVSEGQFVDTLFGARGYTRVAEPSLPADVEEGRRLFYSAIDSRMAASGAGVSCATCHFDGRNDGFTWTLEGEPRNTISLAGPVQDTAPLTWSEEVASVADEAMLTTTLRMGGGVPDADAALIQAYIQSTRYPEARRPGDDRLVKRGKEIFERADVGCATCHTGDLLTDNQAHPVLGSLATQTPTLRGVSASGPYLHDGSAPSLRAVIDWARDGQMGDTSMLSREEVDALVAYLESL